MESEGAESIESNDEVLYVSRKEHITSCQSLLCLLQSLCNHSAVVELRNEISVQGVITHVDHKMK